MDPTTALELSQQAHRQQHWAEAYSLFSELDQAGALAAEDLELFAESANMLGRGDDELVLLRRAYLAHAESGAVGPALRCGYWLCKALAWGSEFAQASGWLARARELAETDPACTGRGYVLMLDAERLFHSGAYAELLVVARRLVEVTPRAADADLVAGAEMTLGNALIKGGEPEAGLAKLDQAMLAVAGGELSARATGMIYCMVIGTCQELHELRRAREWSEALTDWCEAQPEFTGAYRGLCRVHRVAILRLGGGWPTALREARLACSQLTAGNGEIVAGGAYYQLAELHRLRGEFGEAEQAYRDALRHNWDIQPGMALLRLAQGRRDAAAAAIRRALAEAAGQLPRARLLTAATEILLAVGDAPGAARAAAELRSIAEHHRTTALEAMAAHADGAVRLAAQAAEEALTPLRRACRLWHDLDAPYEAARARELIGLACRFLGDEDSATMELAAAAQIFGRLGAGPDAARLADGSPAPSGGLSPRELEVVRLLAAGLSNHAIATELVLSERTVARHVSNILGKLQVGSRTAAAAYAFEHGLV